MQKSRLEWPWRNKQRAAQRMQISDCGHLTGLRPFQRVETQSDMP